MSWSFVSFFIKKNGNSSRRESLASEAISWKVRLESSELTESELQSFFEWLESSPDHQASYVAAEQIWERGKVLANPRLECHLDKKTPKSRNGFLLAVSGVVASLILVVVIFGAPSVDNIQSYQTMLGEQKELLLEDGSRISLSTDSQVLIEFDRKNRLVNLVRGEAFFDVLNDGRPFEVRSEFGVVRVFGTKFLVAVSHDDVEVIVAEGLVGLSTDVVAPDFEVLKLKKNQRISASQALKGMKPQYVDADLRTAWLNGQLIFNEEPLAVVISVLNKYRSRKIFLQDEAIGSLLVTSVIQVDDVDSSVDIIAHSHGLKVIENKNSVVLSNE